MLRTDHSRPVGVGRSEIGFTLIELMVVLSVLSVVIAIAGDVLFSLQNATVRTNALISVEQDASNALSLMARDIRSAHSITFASPTSDASTSVVLNENAPAGGSATTIEWVYQAPTAGSQVGQLKRLVLTSALAVQSTNVVLGDVNNGSTPVFSYFNVHGNSMSTSGSTADATLQNCTTMIGVDLVITPNPIQHVATFTESDTVAITDQQQVLSAPGNQQCGLSS